MRASQVLLFSPAMMPARLAMGAAHGWEVALALVLLVLRSDIEKLVQTITDQIMVAAG